MLLLKLKLPAVLFTSDFSDLNFAKNQIKVSLMDPKYIAGHDDWPTAKREAYQDRPHYQETAIKKPSREGNSFLRSLGGTLMVAGIAWGAYVFITHGASQSVFQSPGPVLTCVAGIVCSLIAKLF